MLKIKVNLDMNPGGFLFFPSMQNNGMDANYDAVRDAPQIQPVQKNQSPQGAEEVRFSSFFSFPK